MTASVINARFAVVFRRRPFPQSTCYKPRLGLSLQQIATFYTLLLFCRKAVKDIQRAPQRDRAVNQTTDIAEPSGRAQGVLGAADALITTELAAGYLQLSPRTLERLRQEGTGPAYIKAGRRVLYRILALQAWLAARTVTSTAEARHKGLQGAR